MLEENLNTIHSSLSPQTEILKNPSPLSLYLHSSRSTGKRLPEASCCAILVLLLPSFMPSLSPGKPIGTEMVLGALWCEEMMVVGTTLMHRRVRPLKLTTSVGYATVPVMRTGHNDTPIRRWWYQYQPHFPHCHLLALLGIACTNVVRLLLLLVIVNYGIWYCSVDLLIRHG